MQALLPVLVYLSTGAGIFSDAAVGASPDKARSSALSSHGASTSLAVVTLCAVAAVYTSTVSLSANALGMSHAVLQVLSFQLVERAGRAGQHGDDSDGLLSQSAASNGEHWLLVLRDVATAATATTALGALLFESSHFGGLQYYGLLGQAMGDNWIFGQAILTVFYALGAVLVHVVMFGALLLMVSRNLRFNGTLPCLLLPTSGCVLPCSIRLDLRRDMDRDCRSESRGRRSFRLEADLARRTLAHFAS